MSDALLADIYVFERVRSLIIIKPHEFDKCPFNRQLIVKHTEPPGAIISK